MKAVGILALAFVMSGCAVGASILSDMLESVGIETVGTRFDGTYCTPQILPPFEMNTAQLPTMMR